MTKQTKAPSGAQKEAADFLDEDEDAASAAADTQEDQQDEEEEEKPSKPVKKGIQRPEKKKFTLNNDEGTPLVFVNRGKFGKFQVPASIGLSAQMLPPITKRSFAVYELCDFFDVHGGKTRDPRIVSGPTEIDAPPYELVNNYKIYDRYEKDLGKREKMLNFEKGVIKEEPVTKDNKMLFQPPGIIPVFTNGQLRIDIESKYTQFVWLELHPRNERNKFRDRQKPPVFRRIDLDVKSTHVEILKMDMQEEAYKYVRKLDHTGLVALASAMVNPTISVGMPDNDIRIALLLRSRTNPEEVLYKSPDVANAAILDIINAMDWGILDFEPARGEYAFSNMPKEPFFVVPMGDKPIEALARYFVGQVEGEEESGAEMYEMMMDMVNFWKG